MRRRRRGLATGLGGLFQHRLRVGCHPACDDVVAGFGDMPRVDEVGLAAIVVKNPADIVDAGALRHTRYAFVGAGEEFLASVGSQEIALQRVSGLLL